MMYLVLVFQILYVPPPSWPLISTLAWLCSEFAHRIIINTIGLLVINEAAKFSTLSCSCCSSAIVCFYLFEVGLAREGRGGQRTKRHFVHFPYLIDGETSLSSTMLCSRWTPALVPKSRELQI